MTFTLVGCANGQIPAHLNALESGAEDAYDYALAGSVDRVQAASEQLDADWHAFRGQAASDGASEATLLAMDEALAGVHAALSQGESGAHLARAVNQVSAPMPDLYELYSPKIPSSVLALDYLGREVALDGALQEAPAGHLTAIDATWSDVRRDVVAHGGGVEAGIFDQHLAEVRTAADTSMWGSLTEAANVLLEDVDALEGVY